MPAFLNPATLAQLLKVRRPTAQICRSESKADGRPHPRHDSVRCRVSSFRSAGKHFFNEIRCGKDVVAAPAHWLEILPKLREELLLEVAVACAAVRESFPHRRNVDIVA